MQATGIVGVIVGDMVTGVEVLGVKAETTEGTFSGDGVAGVGVITGRLMHLHGFSPDPCPLHICAPRSPLLQAHWKEAPGMQTEATGGTGTGTGTGTMGW